jgi:hypothetical protein
MGLIDAGAAAKLDRYIGYYGPYFDSHDALDAGQGRAGRDAQRRPRCGSGRQVPACRATQPTRQADQVATLEVSTLHQRPPP